MSTPAASGDGAPHGAGRPRRPDVTRGRVPRRRAVVRWRNLAQQAAVLAGDHGIDICVTGVGGGKSAVAALKMLRWALRHPRRADGSPTKWCVLGSDFKLVRGVQLEAILEHARRLSVPYAAIVKRVVGGQDPRIELWNGATIYGFSGTDPDRMRGHAFDGVWIDEAEFQTRKSFSMSLARQRSAEKIRLVVTSSPDAAGNGWLWEVISGEFKEWDELRRTIPVRVHRWGSKANTTNKSEVLATIGAAFEATSPGISRQELDGLFVGTAEAPGTAPIDYRKAFVGPVVLTGDQIRAAVVGVDLGKTIDFCWFTAANSSGTVLGMDRFNLSTIEEDVSLEDFWLYARKRLMEFLAEFTAATLVIDTARGGDTFAAMMKETLRDRVHIVGISTDTPGKRTEVIDALSMAISMGRYRIPAAIGERFLNNVEALRFEFKKLEVKDRGMKKVYAHAPGGHDDGVISAALTWHGLSQTSKETPKAGLSGWKPLKLPDRHF